MNNLIPKEIVENMLKDKKVRTNIVQNSFSLFFHFYFSHYIKYETAYFQKEIMSILEKNEDNLYVVSFRNSGKSTIVTTAFPIWSILGKLQKRFVLIICQTESQAKIHMQSLKQELEDNELLTKDLGPFKEESDIWNIKSLKFSKNGSRIMFASIDQKIRGIRNNQTRPDVVILDDIEDLASTRTRDARDKTYRWFKSELVPIGDRDTKIISVGNLLHEDSLMKRIEGEIKEKKIKGIFINVPIIEKDGKINWPGKYETIEDIEKEKEKIGNDIYWKREYLLEIVQEQDAVIDKSWIHYYTDIPSSKGNDCNGVRIGIDLAISEKDTADYTAMVPVKIFGYDKNLKIYVLPKIVNKRINFPQTVETCKQLHSSYYENSFGHPTLVIEDVGYQRSLIQQLNNDGVYKTKPSKVLKSDKRSRLAMTSSLIKEGKILFPQSGAEELINQIVYFGVEKNDDLADAFSSVILNILENPPVCIVFI